MDEHGVVIRNFLLGFVVDAEATGGSWWREVPGEPAPDHDLRAQIARHDESSWAGRASQNADPASRCVVCSDDEIQQCTELRLLALPYASHPAYRSDWQPRATADVDWAREMATVRVAVETPVPPAYPLLANLPGPGVARRRALREARIKVSMRDFNDDEQADRGWYSQGSIPNGRPGA